MDRETVEGALGRLGYISQPLSTGMSTEDRDALLERLSWFPDLPLPTGELADWAVTLITLGKDAAVMASIAAVEATVALTPSQSGDLPFVNDVLAELRVWLASSKKIEDLRRLGDLWWSLTRNPPEVASTSLGYAAVMAWLVAGYDPEGWGDPPEDLAELPDWLKEAADNVTAVIDVFSCIQQAAGPRNDPIIVLSVRSAISEWCDRNPPTA